MQKGQGLATGVTAPARGIAVIVDARTRVGRGRAMPSGQRATSELNRVDYRGLPVDGERGAVPHRAGVRQPAEHGRRGGRGAWL